MAKARKSQSRIRHQRAVGRFQSPYQHGGSIAQGMGLPNATIIYPWMLKGCKYKRRRRRR